MLKIKELCLLTKQEVGKFGIKEGEAGSLANGLLVLWVSGLNGVTTIQGQNLCATEDALIILSERKKGKK